LQALHDEAFTAEEAHAELPLERDADADALGCREKRILLCHELATDFGEVDRDDFSRVRRAERHLLLLRAPVVEHRHEQRLTRQQPLARAHQGAHEPALLLRAVAEYRLHLDPIVHVHHAAGFSNGGLVRIELDFDKLHVVAENFVVNLMHLGHSTSVVMVKLETRI
jgi:hypothetical protein